MKKVMQSKSSGNRLLGGSGSTAPNCGKRAPKILFPVRRGMISKNAQMKEEKHRGKGEKTLTVMYP